MAVPNLNEIVLTTIRNRIGSGRVYYREGAVDRVLAAMYSTPTPHWSTEGVIDKLEQLILAEEVSVADLRAGKVDKWPGLPEWEHEQFIGDYITGMINREFGS